MFIPKIVRWGIKYGGRNEKMGWHIKAMQWGSGGSNSSSHKRSGGKVYRNAKSERLSHVHLFADIGRKGFKR